MPTAIEFDMGRFEFNLDTAAAVMDIAMAGKREFHNILTEPGREVAGAMMHILDYHPTMDDVGILRKVGEVAYTEVMKECT